MGDKEIASIFLWMSLFLNVIFLRFLNLGSSQIFLLLLVLWENYLVQAEFHIVSEVRVRYFLPHNIFYPISSGRCHLVPITPSFPYWAYLIHFVNYENHAGWYWLRGIESCEVLEDVPALASVSAEANCVRFVSDPSAIVDCRPLVYIINLLSTSVAVRWRDSIN